MINFALALISRWLQRLIDVLDTLRYCREINEMVLNVEAVDEVEWLIDFFKVDTEPFDVEDAIAKINAIAPDLPDGRYFDLFEAAVEFDRRRSFVGSMIVTQDFFTVKVIILHIAWVFGEDNDIIIVHAKFAAFTGFVIQCVTIVQFDQSRYTHFISLMSVAYINDKSIVKMHTFVHNAPDFFDFTLTKLSQNKLSPLLPVNTIWCFVTHDAAAMTTIMIKTKPRAMNNRPAPIAPTSSNEIPLAMTKTHKANTARNTAKNAKNMLMILNLDIDDD